MSTIPSRGQLWILRLHLLSGQINNKNTKKQVLLSLMYESDMKKLLNTFKIVSLLINLLDN
ncbi:MAG: hypothetical protein AB8U82_06430 [Rickettsia endosymbiont of Haemaphysalis japonica]